MNRTRVLLLVCLCSLGWLLLSAATASAAPCGDYWTGLGGDSDWATPTNWSGGVPLAATNVCLDNTDKSGSYTVNIDSYNPALVANSITIGGSAGNTVTLAILGTGAGVQVGDTLTLTDQDNGQGVLPTGAITMGSPTGPGIGQPGAIDVSAGTLVNAGTITAASTTEEGQNDAINGSFDNTGTLNLVWNLVGTFGTWTNTGTIDIASGQKLAITAAAASSTFTQAGGTIANQGTFTIDAPNGVGGTVVASGGTITGNDPVLHDSVTLDPSGTGTGTFHIETGGATLGSSIGAGYTVWASGDPGYDHGQLTVNGNVTNAGTLELGSTDGTHGTLNVASGTFTNNGTLIFENTLNGPDSLNGNLVNNGSVQVPDQVQGTGQITNNGSFSVTAGTTVSATSFTQGAGGTLALALASGSIPGLQLTGAATLGGALAVTTTGTVTGSFPVIAAGSLTGTFGATNFTGEAWTLGYSATGLSLTGPASAVPAPVVAAAPKVKSVATGAGTITMKLACPAGGASCSATIQAVVTEHLRGSAIIGIGARKRIVRRTKSVVIASGAVSLKAGVTKTVTFTLNRAGKALLARYGSLSALVTVKAGGETLKTTTVRIHKPAARKRTKH